MPVQEQTVSLYAGTQGYLDAIPVQDVQRFEQGLLEHMRGRYSALLDDIVSTGKIADEEAFRRALAEFADAFEPTVDDEAEPDVTDPGSASRALVDSDITLPEEDISRRDEGDH